MNKRVHLKVLVCLVVVLLPLIFGTVSAQDSAKRLVTAVGASDPQSIDPQLASDQGGVNLSNMMFPGLTRLDEAGTKEVVPGLTTGWDVSDDGLIYTFHLIPECSLGALQRRYRCVEQVMDESGSPRYVTAQDVVYGFTRALDPATGAAGAYMLAPLVAGGDAFNTGGGMRL